MLILIIWLFENLLKWKTILRTWLDIDAILDKVLDKIKEIISIERFHDVKILTDRYNRLAEDFTLKNVVNLITCAIKLYNKFHAQLFLEEVLFDN